MIIFSRIIQAIRTQLALIPEIKKIDEYNMQYENASQEHATAFPAVYIEIVTPLNWQTAGNKMQIAEDAQIRVHVVNFSMKEQLTDHYALTQLVTDKLANKPLIALEGVAPNQVEKQYTTELVRTATGANKRARQVKASIITFSTCIYDDSLMDVLVDGTPIEFNIEIGI